MGLEDRARKHLAARDAKAAREEQLEHAVVQWQARQRARVLEVVSEFIAFVRDHGVAQVSLFYVMPLAKKPLFGKERLEFSFKTVAQVWNIGDEPIERSRFLAGKILTVTEGLQVVPAIRIQRGPGEHVLAIDNTCARTFPPYSVPQWQVEIRPEDFQCSKLDTFAVNPVALGDGDFDFSLAHAMMESEGSAIEGFPVSTTWIEGVVDHAAAAIIDRQTRKLPLSRKQEG